MQLTEIIGFGPAWVGVDPRNNQTVMKLAAVGTCEKCGGYTETIPVDLHMAQLIGHHGRWRCSSCGWIPSLEVYDKVGMKMSREQNELISSSEQTPKEVEEP